MQILVCLGDTLGLLHPDVLIRWKLSLQSIKTEAVICPQKEKCKPVLSAEGII